MVKHRLRVRDMALVPFAVRLARYHAAKPDALKKARRMYKRRWRRRQKAHLKEVLAMARAVLGWKPNVRRGVKLSPKHVAALHAGRDRYHQAKREKKALKKFPNTGRS
jgi:hypothetical protein